MGHTSSKGPCFIAMLVYPNVYILSYHTKAILDVGRKRRGGPGTGVTGHDPSKTLDGTVIVDLLIGWIIGE